MVSKLQEPLQDIHGSILCRDSVFKRSEANTTMQHVGGEPDLDDYGVSCSYMSCTRYV